MSTGAWIGLLIASNIVTTFVCVGAFCLCSVAGRADDGMEAMIRKQEEENCK